MGKENPADMNTKGLNETLIMKYVEMLDMEHREGRSDLAPELHKLLQSENCIRFNSTNNAITKRPSGRHNKTGKMCSEICACEGIQMFCERYDIKQTFY